MVEHFCCRLTPNGIGDLISQLQRVYNLGRSFGLEYVYRELPRNRWSPDLDESDFLGLGLGERRLDEIPGYEIVTVDGGVAADALLQGKPLESVLPAKMPERAVVEFVHSARMYSNGIPIPIRYNIDLRAKLIERHGAHVLTPRDRLSVCVHVRQGDCTWVKRGNRHVFVGKCKITSDPLDPDVERAPHVESYFDILDAVVSRLAGRPCDISIFSDGPTNAFPPSSAWPPQFLYWLAMRDERIIRQLRLARIGNPLQAFFNPMSDPEVRAEYERTSTSLQRMAARYNGAELVVGTSGSLTARAILAFASADVVVMARNPWVFPLLGLGDPEKQAVLLIASPLAENIKRLDQVLSNRLRPENGS